MILMADGNYRQADAEYDDTPPFDSDEPGAEEDDEQGFGGGEEEDELGVD